MNNETASVNTEPDSVNSTCDECGRGVIKLFPSSIRVPCVYAPDGRFLCHICDASRIHAESRHHVRALSWLADRLGRQTEPLVTMEEWQDIALRMTDCGDDGPPGRENAPDSSVPVTPPGPTQISGTDEIDPSSGARDTDEQPSPDVQVDDPAGDDLQPRGLDGIHIRVKRDGLFVSRCLTDSTWNEVDAWLSRKPGHRDPYTLRVLQHLHRSLRLVGDQLDVTESDVLGGD